MSYVFCCLKGCFNGVSFPNNTAQRREVNPILLDTGNMGHEVVIVKNGIRICGSGGVLATAPLAQSKAYFEVKLQQSGIWGIGLATRNADLHSAPGGHDKESWVLCNDGTIRHNKNVIAQVQNNAQEGDILGITYDHVELNFYLNSVCFEQPVIGIRGTVFPALFVDDGAILDIVLDNFNYPPPSGFDRIMLEQSLL